MKKVFLNSVFLACVFIATLVRADELPSEQLAVLLNDLQTTQGSFEQVVYTERGVALQTTTGTFALHRPGLFRWQTQTPSAQLLVADGAKVWLYDHDLNQVSWFKEDLNNAQSPAMLLVGKVQDLTQLYQITLKNTDDQRIFTLKPRHNSFFEQVQLVFEQDGLSMMVIKDHLGQRIQIRFSDLTYDANLNLFHFTPPKGADLVQAAV